MTYQPSKIMDPKEELSRILDHRADLGDDQLFQTVREFVDASMMWSRPPGVNDLVAKSRKLVEIVDSTEAYHGGVMGVDLLQATNDLRLELQRWSK